MLFILICLLTSIFIKGINFKPFSFSLIIWGIILGVIYKYTNNVLTESIDFWINIHPHTFLFIFLPPLIYESSFLIDFHIFKKIYKLIIGFAVLGVIFTFLAVSSYFYLVEDEFNNKYSLIIGAILSATDPIAVIAILSEMKISIKLSIMIEGESLLNDGITIVVFNVVLDYILKDPTISVTVGNIFRLLLGGIIVGFIMTIFKIYWLKKTFNDIISESFISIGVCYLIYYICEFTDLHTSGILALVISGLLMAYYGKTRISPNNQLTIKNIWSILSSISNIIIFILSGIIIYAKIQFNDLTYINWIILIGLFFIINIIRILACLILYPGFISHKYKYDIIDFCIFTFSGLRGEISLALALSINLENRIPENIKNLILFYTSGTVFFSIFINSWLIKFFINHYKKDKILINTHNKTLINDSINKHGNNYIELLKDDDFHLQKADFEFIQNNLLSLSNISNDEVIIQQENNEISNKTLFIKTLKSVIWQLYQQNFIHYDIVLRLTEITDNSLDDIDIKWGQYIDDFCDKNNIIGTDIQILNNLHDIYHCCDNIKNYVIYHKIEFNYNLLLGYILAQKKTYSKLSNLIDNNETLNYIDSIINNSLEKPNQYIIKLETDYPEILIEIETKNLSLLVINEQKKYLNSLFENGEIDEKIHDILFTKLESAEYNLHQLSFLR